MTPYEQEALEMAYDKYVADLWEALQEDKGGEEPKKMEVQARLELPEEGLRENVIKVHTAFLYTEMNELAVTESNIVQLINSVIAGIDFWTAVAAQRYKKIPRLITKEERRTVKSEVIQTLLG